LRGWKAKFPRSLIRNGPEADKSAITRHYCFGGQAGKILVNHESLFRHLSQGTGGTSKSRPLAFGLLYVLTSLTTALYDKRRNSFLQLKR